MNKVTFNGKDFELSVKPSPIDDRDFVAESIYPVMALPSRWDLRNKIGPVRNQGSEGTCSAQAAVAIKDYQEFVEDKLIEPLSVKFIYNHRDNYPISGMYPRDTMKILQKFGTVAEKEYPYSKKEPASKISASLKKKAKEFVIENYAQVNTIDALKKALIQNGVCYIAFPVYNSGDRMWKPENKDQKMQGGHAMAVVGYNKDGFIIRNSWGEDWSEDGCCIYPYSDWGSHWEVWSTIDSNSKKIMWYKYGKRPKKMG